MWHSLVLNGIVPIPGATGGEFILTVSSIALTSSVGSIFDKLDRPEIGMATKGNVGTNAPYVALRSTGKQFPNGSPPGDFFVMGGTSTVENALNLDYAGVGPLQTDSSKVVRAWFISLSSQVIGTLPLANMVSSVTVGGILTAGSNITITPGSGITTIAATGVSGSSATAGVTVYNGGVALSTTQAYARNYYYVPYACTISSWTVMQDSGSITYDVKISSGSAFPTTVSMVGAGTKPILTGGTFTGSAPASWQQTNIPAGSQLEFTVEAATTTRKSSLTLTLWKQ